MEADAELLRVDVDVGSATSTDSLRLALVTALRGISGMFPSSSSMGSGGGSGACAGISGNGVSTRDSTREPAVLKSEAVG